MLSSLNPDIEQVRAEDELTTVAKGAGIVLLGYVFKGILLYLFSFILARLIGAESLGLYFLGVTIVMIVAMVARIGLHNGVLRYVALYRGQGDFSRAKGTFIIGTVMSFVFGLILGITLFLTAAFWAISIFHKPGLIQVIKSIAWSLPFVSVSVILVVTLKAFYKMKYHAYIKGIIEPGLPIIIFFACYLVGLRLNAAIVSYILTSVIVCVCGVMAINRISPLFKRTIRPQYELKELLTYSAPLFFVTAFTIIQVQIDTLMLGYFTGAKEVGIYGIAAKLAMAGFIILDSFNAIFAPMIADLYHKKEYEKLGRMFKIVTRWIITISLPLYLILLLFSREIMSVFGPEFVAGGICLVILVIGQLVNSGSGSVGYMLTMTGKTGVALFNAVAACLLNILLNYILIPRYGISGAALATAVSIAAVNLLRLLEIYLIMGIQPYGFQVLKPVFIGVGIFLLFNFFGKMFFIANTLQLVMAIGLVMAAYAGGIYLLGMAEDDEQIVFVIRRKLNGLISQSGG